MIKWAITLAAAFMSASILLGAQPPGTRASGAPSGVPGVSNNGTSQSGYANAKRTDRARHHADSRNAKWLPQWNKDRGYGLYRPRNWAGSYGFFDYGYFSPYPDPSIDKDAGYRTGYGPGETADHLVRPRDESGSQDKTNAQITIAAPAGTEIWIDDAKVADSGGQVYTFPTPPLEPSRRYTYTIKARWREHEQSVTQSQDVAFTAGAGVMVRFPKPADPGK
jgi:uncharacterized protein (TIGR03000 family)